MSTALTAGLAQLFVLSIFWGRGGPVKGDDVMCGAVCQWQAGPKGLEWVFVGQVFGGVGCVT